MDEFRLIHFYSTQKYNLNYHKLHQTSLIWANNLFFKTKLPKYKHGLMAIALYCISNYAQKLDTLHQISRVIKDRHLPLKEKNNTKSIYLHTIFFWLLILFCVFPEPLHTYFVFVGFKPCTLGKSTYFRGLAHKTSNTSQPLHLCKSWPRLCDWFDSIAN